MKNPACTLARWLQISPREDTRDLMVEAAPVDVLDAEQIALTIPPESKLHSTSALELHLPAPRVVTLVIRDGKTFVPSRDTQLRTGDELLIVTTRTGRDQTERRLRAVSRAARPLVRRVRRAGVDATSGGARILHR